MNVEVVAILAPMLVAAVTAADGGRIRTDQVLPYAVGLMGMVCAAVLLVSR